MGQLCRVDDFGKQDRVLRNVLLANEQARVCLLASKKTLEKNPHFGDEVVVVRVEAGSGDLHAGIEDEKGMRGLPLFAPHHIEGRGGDKVLHLSVVAAAEIESRVVLDLDRKS